MRSLRPTAIQLAHLFRIDNKNAQLNPIAIAIITTEMKFRPLHFRLAEYLLLLLYWIFNKKPKLSLGISQISYKYWSQEYGPSKLSIISKIFSPYHNYLLCCSLIKDAKNTKEALKIYNTKISKPYFIEFNKNYTLLVNKNNNHPPSP